MLTKSRFNPTDSNMLLQRDVFTILFLFHLLDAFKWCQWSNTIYLSPCVEMLWFYFLGALMNYHTWCRLVINRSWLTRHMFLYFHCQHYSDRSHSCPTVIFIIFLLVVIKYDYEAAFHGASSFNTGIMVMPMVSFVIL